MKQLYNMLINSLQVVEDPFWNFVILTIIGSISFLIAWNFVGETEIRGKIGSILHWTIRIIIMVLLSKVIAMIIKLIVVIFKNPLNIWIIIAIILLIILIIIILKITVFSSEEKKNRSINKQKNRYVVLMKRIIDNYYNGEKSVLKQEDIIDKKNQKDKYIYNEIKDMLMKEKLIIKDKNNNDIIEFRTIIFLEQYVKNNLSYRVSMLAFLLPFSSLIISIFSLFFEEHENIFSLFCFIVIIVVTFRTLPKRKKRN